MGAARSSGGPNMIGNKEALIGSNLTLQRTSTITDPNQPSTYNYGRQTPTQQPAADQTMYNPITATRTNAQEYKMGSRRTKSKERKES